MKELVAILMEALPLLLTMPWHNDLAVLQRLRLAKTFTNRLLDLAKATEREDTEDSAPLASAISHAGMMLSTIMSGMAVRLLRGPGKESAP